MLVRPDNETEAAVALIREHHDEVAGVMREPFQRIVPPKPGFLEAVRAATAEYGIPLIFDEVVTGFRFAYGGAQELYGVVPDICTLGKIVGGGYPLSAVAGRSEEHTSELQSLMRISYAVFCLKKKNQTYTKYHTISQQNTKT